MWGIDVSVDRSHSRIAAAVFDANGNPVVSLRERRKGLMWVPEYMQHLAEESGMWRWQSNPKVAQPWNSSNH